MRELIAEKDENINKLETEVTKLKVRNSDLED